MRQSNLASRRTRSGAELFILALFNLIKHPDLDQNGEKFLLRIKEQYELNVLAPSVLSSPTPRSHYGFRLHSEISPEHKAVSGLISKVIKTGDMGDWMKCFCHLRELEGCELLFFDQSALRVLKRTFALISRLLFDEPDLLRRSAEALEKCALKKNSELLSALCSPGTLFQNFIPTALINARIVSLDLKSESLLRSEFLISNRMTEELLANLLTYAQRISETYFNEAHLPDNVWISLMARYVALSDESAKILDHDAYGIAAIVSQIRLALKPVIALDRTGFGLPVVLILIKSLRQFEQWKSFIPILLYYSLIDVTGQTAWIELTPKQRRQCMLDFKKLWTIKKSDGPQNSLIKNYVNALNALPVEILNAEKPLSASVVKRLLAASQVDLNKQIFFFRRRKIVRCCSETFRDVAPSSRLRNYAYVTHLRKTNSLRLPGERPPIFRRR